MAAKQVRVALGESLPCCAYDGWQYCEQPAVAALGEPVAAATGHFWRMVPLCEKHLLIARVPATDGKQPGGKYNRQRSPL